jgi:hypothetical protein
VPDGDVGSATTHPEETISADGDVEVTRPDTPPTAAPAGDAPTAAAPTAPIPRPPRRKGRLIGANRSDDGAEPTAMGNGTPTAARVRAPAGAPEAPTGVFDDEAAAGNGAAAQRPSMSTRLGTVPDAPRDPDVPLVVRPNAPEHPSDTADPTDPVLLVPEVLPPSAPGVPTRIVPVMPDIVPASQPDVIAPPPTAPQPQVESDPALYDLADDDPALVLEQPPTRIRRRRPRVRRVTRVVRTIDTWSVFKVALLFSGVLYVSALISGVLLWNVAYATGTVDNAERFMESFGWQTFEFHGGEIFHDAWIIGMFAAAGLTGLAVLAAATFNLVSDIVGGVRVTVLEEEMVVRPVTRRRKQRIRKAPPRAATTAMQMPSEPTPEPGSGLALHSD